MFDRDDGFADPPDPKIHNQLPSERRAAETIAAGAAGNFRGNELPRRVGPVLAAGELGQAVALAIVELNPGAQVLARRAYYRVLAAEHCAVTRSAIERISGRPFILPGDLESVMPAFTGYLSLNAHVACWTDEAS